MNAFMDPCIAGAIKSQTVDSICNNPLTKEYYGFIINGEYVKCKSYYTDYLITPINVVGGIFFGIGVLLGIAAAAFFYTGRFSSEMLPVYIRPKKLDQQEMPQ